MKRLLSAVALFFAAGLSVTAQGMDIPQPIPEPATWTLALLGGGGALAIAYFRKRRR